MLKNKVPQCFHKRSAKARNKNWPMLTTAAQIWPAKHNLENVSWQFSATRTITKTDAQQCQYNAFFFK